MKPIVFMLSGQGSQYYQMGLDLYSENEHFNKNIHALDALIKERFNISLIDTIYDQTKSISTPFTDPLLSSLAIYLVEHALASTLINYGITADKIIGSSMGIFVASLLTNCIDKEQGLEAIYHLMRLVKEKCMPGRMIAVLGDPKLYENSEILKKYCQLAAVDENFSFVISMPLKDAEHVEAHLKEIDVTFQRLPVSKPYHSSWMDVIKEAFLSQTLTPKKPSIPLICCAKTEALESVNTADLWEAVRAPLLFSKTIAKIEADTAYRYIDIGPSGMMATCLKYILPKNSESDIYMILNPYQQASKNFSIVLEQCQ